MHKYDITHTCSFAFFLPAKENNKIVKIVDFFLLNKLDALQYYQNIKTNNLLLVLDKKKFTYLRLENNGALS